MHRIYAPLSFRSLNRQILHRIYAPHKLLHGRQILRRIFALGTKLGGEVSGEHGLGRDKRHYWHEIVDPRTLQLQRQIKSLFDPQNILNPDLDKDYP